VQNDATKILLNSIEIENIAVVGDTRFDNVLANKRNFKFKLENLSTKSSVFYDFLNGKKAIIFGSSWEPEEAILNESLINLKHEKFIIAPHNVSESNVARLANIFGNNAIRFTQFEKYNQQSILILDTIGHLSTAYCFGKVAFVGGGFSGQLHNILEPAVFGLPVFFGPKHSKFPEAEIFIEEGFAFHVESATEFIERLNFVSENDKSLSKKASEFIEKQKGAAKRIVNDLKRF
jgi:3-deoxy-D-manno-octulosonic-acid transferase